MRNAFISELISLTRDGANTALVVGDLGYGVVENFRQEFPQRFFNAGVAEQNMMGLAAGLASEGFHVFAYSIANFPTFRCAEQIRNDIDYHNLPVTIVAVGGGLAYGNLGYSHHAVQDYALMRALPNIMIAAPGDPMETKACMRYLMANPQPSYLRLGKTGERNIHQNVPTISPGLWCPVSIREGNIATYLTTGAALELVDTVTKNTMVASDWDIYSMPLWGMRYKSMQPNQIDPYQRVKTVEDHLYDGGFGSWMLESSQLMKSAQAKVELLALDSSVCGKVGNQLILNMDGGLTKEKICG